MNNNTYHIEAKRGLNRDFIKFLAAITMFLNHFAHALLPKSFFLTEIYIDIGFFTAITMCFFLVEGFSYTHSKRAYFKRLLIFALISEIPYCMALGYFQLNMFFTLMICFIILCVIERVTDRKMKILFCTVLTLMTALCDWALLAPIYTIMFALCKNKRQYAIAYGIGGLLFFVYNAASYMISDASYTMGYIVLHSMYACVGIFLSALVILNFYTGKRVRKWQLFLKWFFYIFYPLHLMILGLIRCL